MEGLPAGSTARLSASSFLEREKTEEESTGESSSKGSAEVDPSRSLVHQQVDEARKEGIDKGVRIPPTEQPHPKSESPPARGDDSKEKRTAQENPPDQEHLRSFVPKGSPDQLGEHGFVAPHQHKGRRTAGPQSSGLQQPRTLPKAVHHEV